MPEILVVGGSSGLGYEFVKVNISQGNKVVVISRRDNDLPGVINLNCNLGDLKAVDCLIQDLLISKLRFDSLIFFQRSRGSLVKHSWQSEFDVSVSSTRKFLQDSQKMLRDDGAKSIVVVNSIAGTFVTHDASDSYQISKAALRQLVRYYASSLGKHGIRVNSVSPFAFVKDSSKDFLDFNHAWNQIISQRIPLGRNCTPEDIIYLIEFLIGHRSGYITGQDICIDGGLSLSLGVDIS